MNYLIRRQNERYTIMEFINLKKLCLFCGTDGSPKAVPLHELAGILKGTYVNALPSLHACIGYDTTSNIGPKRRL